MKTVRVPVLNELTGEKQYANGLLDSGSKRTYVIEPKARSLHLRKGRKATVNMNTFGKSDPSQTKTQKTSFKIIQKNGSLKEIEAKIVKTISGPMSRRKINLDK